MKLWYPSCDAVATPQRRRIKMERKARKTSLLPNKFVCAIKTNLVRTCVEMFVEIVQKNDDLKFYVQVVKCVQFWVLVDISNRTQDAEVLRFNASKFGICKSS